MNVKTVAASMRRQGLEGISPRMFTPVTTIPGTPTHRIPDRVKRAWDTGELNRVWISDITYLRTSEGWLYLCVVRDACSRRVLGWAMDSHQDADLVERALRTATTLRGQTPDRIVFHADRGTQAVHLNPTTSGLRRTQHRTIDGAHRGVLRQRHGRVFLRHAKDRVLPPFNLAHPGPGPYRRSAVDRCRLQPSPTPLIDQLQDTGRLRTPHD